MPSDKKKRRTRRRGNGEGSIFQRGDGKWTGSISLGFKPNGQRNRRTVYGKTKKEAQDKLTKLQQQRLDGSISEPTKMKVANHLDRWLKDSVKDNLADSTYTRYEGIVRNHIKPRIGGIRLARLTPIQVQAMYADMKRDGYSNSTRHYVHAVLHTALTSAVKLGMVPRNVCNAVDAPKPNPKDIHPLNQEQVQQLLNESKKHRLHAVFVMAVTTGLRMGELFGLKWADIDLEQAVLSVRRTLEEIRGHISFKEPKSATGKRRVHLPQMAVETLHEHRKQILAEGHAGCEFVFCDTTGKPLRKTNFSEQVWKPIRSASGIHRIRFHDLRHTVATLLLTAGVHPKVVQERLGHANIAITLDTYSHVLPSLQEEAASKLDGLFGTEIAWMATQWLHSD